MYNNKGMIKKKNIYNVSINKQPKFRPMKWTRLNAHSLRRQGNREEKMRLNREKCLNFNPKNRFRSIINLLFLIQIRINTQ